MLIETSPYDYDSSDSSAYYDDEQPDNYQQNPSSVPPPRHHQRQQHPQEHPHQQDSPPRESTSSSGASRASLYDHWREGVKDLELDIKICKDEWKQSYRDSLRAVRRVYRDTNQVVSDTARQTTTHAKTQVREIKRDVQTQKQLMKQDFRELVQLGKAWKDKVTSRRRRQERSRAHSYSSETSTSSGHESHESTSNTHAPPSPTTPPTSTELGLEQRIQAIRDWERELSDPAQVLTHLNQLIASQLTSPQDLVDYYKGKPELKRFTLDKELTRMQYLVITKDGERLMDVDSIRSYETTSLGSGDSLYDDILWRAANQSLFGDIITSLTSPQGLVRPQFSTATCVDDVSMTIDCSRQRSPHPLLRGECYLNVSIPGEEGERLPLAGALVEVYFCPQAYQLEARLVHLSPCPALTDEQVRGAATHGI